MMIKHLEPIHLDPKFVVASECDDEFAPVSLVHGLLSLLYPFGIGGPS